MSRITVEQVQAMAALARIGITNTEAAEMAEKLDQVLENFSRIQHVDTSSVPPADDVTGLQNVARADIAEPECLCAHEELLKAAPATQAGHIKVKAVF